MPTIDEVIARVDARKPNVYSDEDKARWLMELDGRLYRELFARWPAAQPEIGKKPPEQWPEEGGAPLLVEPPYDGLYELYLEAMVDYYDQETEAYNNAAALFDQAESEFRKQYRRTHAPPRGGVFRHY